VRIAILGTRGIPNNYGGFEQLAQYLSVGLIEHGHDVWVYSSARHPYKQTTWKGVNIVHRFDPENLLGSFGQFVYDLACILHARRQKFDVVLNLGYTSSSVWLWLLPNQSRIITNMDGLEWKRSKYSPMVKRFLVYAEKLAVKRSHTLVADSQAIQTYLYSRFSQPSAFIAYGADVFEQADEQFLAKYKVQPYSYDILVARMEPENNIEMILDGVEASAGNRTFLVVGNIQNRYGTYIAGKFKNSSRIRFTGPVYDAPEINNLRFYSNLYFHGHSVGGTNPSLLESMACNCFVAAHDNEFNRGVLAENACYFSSVADVARIVANERKMSDTGRQFTAANLKRVKEQYSWPRIVMQYEKLMTSNEFSQP